MAGAVRDPRAGAFTKVKSLATLVRPAGDEKTGSGRPTAGRPSTTCHLTERHPTGRPLTARHSTRRYPTGRMATRALRRIDLRCPASAFEPRYITPWSSMAWATFRKPPMFAPLT